MEILVAEELEKETWPYPAPILVRRIPDKELAGKRTSNPPRPSGIGVRKSDGESMIMWSLYGEEETSPSSLKCSLGILTNMMHGNF